MILTWGMNVEIIELMCYVNTFDVAGVIAQFKTKSKSLNFITLSGIPWEIHSNKYKHAWFWLIYIVKLLMKF